MSSTNGESRKKMVKKMVEVEVEEDDDDIEEIWSSNTMTNNYINTNDDENHQDNDEDDEEEDDDDSDAEVINITQNPFYHILGAYFENENGKNIADVFSAIKRSIDRNTQVLSNIEKHLAKKYSSNK